MACYESYLGDISISPLPYAPQNFAFCNGSMMSVSQNCALFSLLGTVYGGNGYVTFQLPDFRGRTPMGTVPYSYDPPPDALNYTLGLTAGYASVLPKTVTAEKPKDGDPIVFCAKPDAIQTLPPYLVLNFILCTRGIYPSRP